MPNARSVLETHGPSIVEFLRGMRGAIHVAFEEGAQSQWLHDLLAPLVDRVVVCDRRGQARQGNKGDQVDAERLSESLRVGGPRPVYHGSAQRADLKELTRAYRTLVEDGTRVMLRINALFRARAIPTRGTAVYQARRRGQWLAQLPERGARFRAETLYAELDVLRNDAEADCPAYPEARGLAPSAVGAACQGKERPTLASPTPLAYSTHALRRDPDLHETPHRAARGMRST